MAKRFKLKISRLLLSFRLCRSIKPTNLPDIPFPSIGRLSPVNPTALGVGYRNLNLPAPPPPTPDFSVMKRHLSPKIASATRNKMENVKANAETETLISTSRSFGTIHRQTHRRSAVEGGREGGGERSGGEEIGGSVRGFQEVNDGNDNGEADVPSGGIGAAVAVLSFVEFD
ncbi:hypothetical protein F3Y22_tig00111197pilonHSYRG00011 [Hibiscus syriacus]|uniref:Uncharacterized protein n=1 Tax=Hibiscus syriacus TaxID=106335 RepID=A0A6A2YWE2_HIBSY|nr:hypothetical protein F3Y22_tig00111197pilonHSYRG00011 [Hibiscus syriacus]